MTHFPDQLSHFFIEELIDNSAAYYEQPKDAQYALLMVQQPIKSYTRDHIGDTTVRKLSSVCS